MKFNIKTILGILTILLLIIGIFIFMNYASDKPLSELKEKWTYDNSQFIEVDGLDVHYRINGRGHPLVLIHGTGASLHTWEPWTNILEKDFKVISLDMPAFGLTGPNATGVYSLKNYAQFLDEFLTKIEIDSFHLGGNSLGGGISWKYATMFPDKVKKLILLDASGYPSDKEPPLAFKLANNPITSKLLLTVTPKGAEDLWVDPAHAARFDKDIPNSKLIMYEKVGHIPMEEIPERSAMDVRAFLMQPDFKVISEN